MSMGDDEMADVNVTERYSQIVGGYRERGREYKESERAGSREVGREGESEGGREGGKEVGREERR